MWCVLFTVCSTLFYHCAMLLVELLCKGLTSHPLDLQSRWPLGNSVLHLKLHHFQFFQRSMTLCGRQKTPLCSRPSLAMVEWRSGTLRRTPCALLFATTQRLVGYVNYRLYPRATALNLVPMQHCRRTSLILRKRRWRKKL